MRALKVCPIKKTGVATLAGWLYGFGPDCLSIKQIAMKFCTDSHCPQRIKASDLTASTTMSSGTNQRAAHNTIHDTLNMLMILTVLW